ncbi:hypothetical protein [Massilia genomosp. 1]|uniref:WYL domain-containing protein n=1 Tax=Massilia genomosp. 1 TaxID=2609280 RepID=A0ABX0MTL8_9BURK|nr:hypothetical protein [Massilia genomosp. 1]NHZ62644.1 hypothetical protein [Massilia genomosp. 1]
MNSIIKLAIENKQVLELRYNEKVRLVEPHCYGTDKNGEEKLRCYQQGNRGLVYDKGAWKILSVSEIRNLTATGNNFRGPRPDYNPDDPQISRIYARL